MSPNVNATRRSRRALTLVLSYVAALAASPRRAAGTLWTDATSIVMKHPDHQQLSMFDSAPASR